MLFSVWFGIYFGCCIGWGAYCMIENALQFGCNVYIHHHLLAFALNTVFGPFVILCWLYKRYLDGLKGLGLPIIYVLK